MKKVDYLQDEDIKSFVEWFSKEICSTGTTHGYIERQKKLRFEFSGLADAQEKYLWRLLRAVVDRMAAESVFHHAKDPIRAVEAALFMWGL